MQFLVWTVIKMLAAKQIIFVIKIIANSMEAKSIRPVSLQS